MAKKKIPHRARHQRVCVVCENNFISNHPKGKFCSYHCTTLYFNNQAKYDYKLKQLLERRNKLL